MADKILREGFTTGTASTAAAMAAVRALLTGQKASEMVVPLPVGGVLTIPILSVLIQGESVRAVVVKDAGDDPDATHRARIEAVVRIEPAEAPHVEIDGGKGVGRVTLPGLPVDIGRAAINPVPMQQIEAGVRAEMEAAEATGRVFVTVEVPDGEAIARHTLNPRLGIVGGISILGTRGTVRPYSHEAWKATISQGLQVALATGCREIFLSTGGRSERALREYFNKAPEHCFVQAADFFAYSMQDSVAHGFESVTWGLFFGKLVKQAQGLGYTHARTAPTDFPLLARWLEEIGVDSRIVTTAASANTARQILEMLATEASLAQTIGLLSRKAAYHALQHAGGSLRNVRYVVFDFDGNLLADHIFDKQEQEDLLP